MATARKKASFFITGTGTDVGKTRVSALLFKQLKKKNERVAYCKPIQTGANLDGANLVAPDSQAVYAQAQGAGEEATTSSYLFAPACSPHLAAELSQQKISISKVVADIYQIQKEYDLVLIEGAGGVFVPLTETKTMCDLIEALKVPALVVFDNTLGAINQTLMTIKGLREQGVEILAVISNETTPRSAENEFIRKDNLKAIEQFSGEKVLGEVLYQQESGEGLAEVVEELLRERLGG